MSNDNKNDFLKKTDLFASLPDEELDEIMDKIIVKQFKKNETVFYEEDTNELMYLILIGKIKAIRTTEDGKEIILAIHKAGSFFGEMSLIDGKTAPASIVALENSLLAIITKEDFTEITMNYPAVTMNLLKILCSRLRKSWDNVQLLNFNNAAQRVKMLLYSLSEDHGTKSENGVDLNIKLTHQDISDMSGLTRETVTRVIDKMQKSKEISVGKNKLISLSNNFMLKDFRISY